MRYTPYKGFCCSREELWSYLIDLSFSRKFGKIGSKKPESTAIQNRSVWSYLVGRLCIFEGCMWIEVLNQGYQRSLSLNQSFRWDFLDAPLCVVRKPQWPGRGRDLLVILGIRLVYLFYRKHGYLRGGWNNIRSFQLSDSSIF